MTAQTLVALVVEGVQRANQTQPRTEERVQMSPLKMTNPKSFDGKTTSSFNTWWRSVTKYLGFYPETRDQQKIAWVGTLLTGTAKAWDLHRYEEMGEHDTWEQYSLAIRTD